MSRSKRPRKQHRPRLARIPVMPELIGQFELALYTQLARIKLERTVADRAPLDACAQAYNTLITAYPAEMETPAITGFGRLLRSLIERQASAGRVTVNEHDMATLENGVNEIIGFLPRADVSRLYVASQALMARARLERRAA